MFILFFAIADRHDYFSSELYTTSYFMLFKLVFNFDPYFSFTTFSITVVDVVMLFVTNVLLIGLIYRVWVLKKMFVYAINAFL